jgi:hypothetical protein
MATIIVDGKKQSFTIIPVKLLRTNKRSAELDQSERYHHVLSVEESPHLILSDLISQSEPVTEKYD